MLRAGYATDYTRAYVKDFGGRQTMKWLNDRALYCARLLTQKQFSTLPLKSLSWTLLDREIIALVGPADQRDYDRYLRSLNL